MWDLLETATELTEDVFIATLNRKVGILLIADNAIPDDDVVLDLITNKNVG